MTTYASKKILAGLVIAAAVAGFFGVTASAFAHSSGSSGVCTFVIDKSVDKANAAPGDVVEYTINFKNIGTADCTGTGVHLFDQVDTRLTYLSETHSSNVTAGYDGPVFRSSDHSLNWNAATVSPNESGWVKWKGTVNPMSSCTDTIPNTAYITSEEYDNFHTWVQSNTVSVHVAKDCTPPPTKGCIQIKKETYDTAGNILTPVAQFSFKLDGGTTVQNDANGNAIFSNITPGTHTVTEVDAGSTWTQLSVTPANGTVTVSAGSVCAAVVFKNKQVLPGPSCTLDASPESIVAGGSSALSWTTANASSVSIDNSIGSVSANGSKSVSPSSTTTYTLTATGNNGQVKKCTKTITVTQPAKGCIQVKKETYDTAGNILTPVAQFSFKLDNGLTIQNDANGDAIFSNVTPGTHTVTEVNSGSAWNLLSVTPANGTVTVQSGSVCAAVVFKNQQTLTPGPTCSLSASPSSLTAPGSTTLTWTSANATAASIDNGVNSVSPVSGGSINVAVSASTNYTMTVTGPGGTATCHAPVVITTPGLSCNLSISSSSIHSGDSATLSWSSANASSGSIDNNVGNVSPVSGGSVTVFPSSSTTYHGTFTGPSGTVNCSVPITVTTGSCTNCGGGGLNQPTVALFKSPTEQPLAFVSLSQIPYTGFEAGPALTMIFWLAIAGLSAFVAYGVTGQGSMRHAAAYVLGGFMGIPLRREEDEHDTHSYGPSYPVDEPVSQAAYTASVAAPAISYAPAVTPMPAVTKKTQESSVPGIEDVIESRAHAAGVLMSPEAVTIATETSTDRAEALRFFGSILDEAVRTIPREDGWIMLTTDRVQALIAKKGGARTAAAPTLPTLEPVDEHAAFVFAGAIVSGDRDTAFSIVRTLEHDGVSPTPLMAGSASAFDKLYRARRDNHSAPDEVFAEKAAHLSDDKLARLVEIFAHALDHVYASPFTGVKLALAQAFETLGA